MAKGGRTRFSITGVALFPHVKVTREPFPRVLATRFIADVGADHFGAFLNRTNARILVDFLVRAFRVRGCELELDGGFPVPCIEFHRKRCLAPCVASLCSEAQYGERIGLVRLFLANERELLRKLLASQIEAAAEQLDFEAAAELRDLLAAIEAFWADTRHSVWLDAAVDTIEARESGEGLDIFLISQKGRRVLGERTFTFPDAGVSDAPVAIADVIRQFYLLHLPREIRVSHSPAGREELTAELAARHGRPPRLTVIGEEKRRVTADLAVYRSSAELDLNRRLRPASPGEIRRELKRLFGLAKLPGRITAIDAAHTAGSDMAVASVAWEDGRTLAGEARYALIETNAEPGALAEHTAAEAARDAGKGLHLIAIDGGRPQLNAVEKALADAKAKNVVAFAVVKPPGRHDDVSHFITAQNGRIEFDPASPSMLLLQRLRDEAHDLANAVHRGTRDFAHFYIPATMLPSLNEHERQVLVRRFGSHTRLALATQAELAESLGPAKARAAFADVERFTAGGSTPVRPLIVPLRYQDENGAADDLRPIESSTAKSKLKK